MENEIGGPEAEQGRQFHKDDFNFQQATKDDAARLTAYYNSVIDYNRKNPDRVLNWSP